jgi:hypothetical protein
MKLGLKVNKKELVNTAIGLLAVRYAPALVRMVLPSYSTGMTGNLIAGAVGVGVGVALKSPTVQTVAIASAVTNIAGGYIDPMLGVGNVSSVSVSPAGTLQNYAKLQGLKDYPRTLQPSRNFSNVYNS